MKTIKIIDLLNKIANGEEVPNKIKYIGYIFEYDTNHKRYEAYIDGCMYALNEYVNIDEDLTYEVEIIEEGKKLPEKIKSNGKEFYCDNIDSWIDKEKTSAYCEYLMNKYNDLIDYLESKEKGE